MGIQEIEKMVIECLKKNLELSGDEVPSITGKTRPAFDLRGFDSLRALEVIVSLEEQFNCDLPPEKIFFSARLEDVSVSSIAVAIEKIRKEKSK